MTMTTFSPLSPITLPLSSLPLSLTHQKGTVGERREGYLLGGCAVPPTTTYHLGLPPPHQAIHLLPPPILSRTHHSPFFRTLSPQTD